MKVLKQGVENDNLPTVSISCTGKGIANFGKACGALLEITPLDVQTGTHTDISGCTDRYYYIVCPICGSMTEVYLSNLSSEFKSLLK